MPRKPVRPRLDEIKAAFGDEMTRLHRALGAGAQVYLDTFLGPRRLVAMCHAYDGPAGRDDEGRAWALGNDGAWAGLLQQAGVERNRMWR